MHNAQELSTLVGKIIINFNALELMIRRLVWALIDRENPRKGHVITKALMTQAVIALGFGLLKVDTLDDELKVAAKRCLQDGSEIAIERNKVAHVLFRVKNEAVDTSEIYTAWPQHNKKGVLSSSGEPLSKAQLEELNTSCIELGDAISDLLKQIGVNANYGNTLAN